MQLRRYIIEIMSFTFNADFTLLNQALGQSASTVSASLAKSILTQHERAELLKLAELMENIKAKGLNLGKQWLIIRSRDREVIAAAVVRPALYLELPVAYVLEVISTYSSHRCDGSKRSLSFIEQSKPCFYNILKSLSFLGPFNVPLGIFTNHLWSHAQVINLTVSNEGLRLLLANAMDIYQKQVLGIKDVQHIEKHFESDEWKELKKVLISEDEEWEIGYQRRKRKRQEADKRVQSDSLAYSAGAQSRL